MSESAWLSKIQSFLTDSQPKFKAVFYDLLPLDRYSTLVSATADGSINSLDAQAQLSLLASCSSHLTLVSTRSEFSRWLSANGREDVVDFLGKLPQEKSKLIDQLISGLYFSIDDNIVGVNAFGEDLHPSVGKGLIILSSSRASTPQAEAFNILHEAMHANALRNGQDIEYPEGSTATQKQFLDRPRLISGRKFSPATQLAELKSDGGALALLLDDSLMQQISGNRSFNFSRGDFNHANGRALTQFNMAKVDYSSLDAFLKSVSKEAENVWSSSLLDVASVDGPSRQCVEQFKNRRREAFSTQDALDCIDRGQNFVGKSAP